MTNETQTVEVTLGADQFELVSAGIDIGSATTQMIFSRITMERRDARYIPIARCIIYSSPILLTPYRNGERLDESRLANFFEQQYEGAGLHPEDVDTGVLIMTGTALLRDNAHAIGRLFSQEGGRLVSLAAGDRMESIIAAYGSGAVLRSLSAGPVLNIDVGGGTTKLALCEGGKVTQVAALDVGSRLLVRNNERQVTRLENRGKDFGMRLGLFLHEGQILDDEGMERISDEMARAVLKAAGANVCSSLLDSVQRTPGLNLTKMPSHVLLSGGVSDFFSIQPTQDFGDLGGYLAIRLRELSRESSFPLEATESGIRATVLGASQYTVQVSGATILVSGPSLPVRDAPVVVPAIDLSRQEIDANTVAVSVQEALDRLGLVDGRRVAAIYVPWSGSPTFARLSSLCRGIARGIGPILRHGHAAILVTDADVGRLLGSQMKRELGQHSPVIAIDGIDLREMDFIDIGSVLPGSTAVPVTIKSIMFGVEHSRSHQVPDQVTGEASEPRSTGEVFAAG